MINAEQCNLLNRLEEYFEEKTYKGKLLKINLQTRFDYPVQPNGKGQVYCIPISKFEIISE